MCLLFSETIHEHLDVPLKTLHLLHIRGGEPQLPLEEILLGYLSK
jgi:hypothetical protein